MSNEIAVGMLGHGFMGKTHSIGYRDARLIAGPGVPSPRLLAISGRDPQRLALAQKQFGWEQSVSDWREIVANPAIQLFDNAGPNDMHVEPTIAAARAALIGPYVGVLPCRGKERTGARVHVPDPGLENVIFDAARPP